MSDRAIRFDVGGLGRFEATPQGFLRVPGNVTRVGVLNYTRSDGSTFRELRHPDEVFRPDSVRSLGFAPVTDRHPAELVSPKNVRDLQVGIVTNARAAGARRDAGADVSPPRFIRSDLIVQDARMIEKVRRGDARELSAGYTCRIDATPGEFQGERYDGIQRGITYNHVALGPRDWGRAGPDVALHMDGLSDDLRSELGVERFDEELAKLLELHPEAVLPLKTDGLEPERKEKPVTTQTIRIDGLEYEVDPKTAAAYEKNQTALEARADSAEKRADALEGERDTLKAELEETKAKLDAATDPEKIQAAVRARGELEANARKVIGPEAKFDGKTDRDIKVEAIRCQDEKFDAADRSDGYVDGRFEALVQAAPDRRDSRDEARKAVVNAGGGTVLPPEGKVVKLDSAAAARKASIAAAKELGRAPLPSTRRRSR